MFSMLLKQSVGLISVHKTQFLFEKKKKKTTFILYMYSGLSISTSRLSLDHPFAFDSHPVQGAV